MQSIFNVQPHSIQPTNSPLADAISFAQATLCEREGWGIAINDATVGKHNGTYVVTLEWEQPKHVVVIRGGHSLYCVTCDADIARLPSSSKATMRFSDVRHVAPVRAIMAPSITVIPA